jgi:miniconductance mechanosensitive channel
MVAPVLIYVLLPVVFPREPDVVSFLQRLCMIYIIATFLRFINVFLTAIYHVYSEKEQFKDRPLKGLLQTAQVTLFFIGGIAIVSILMNKSPAVLLTGLGASAAILMLVFKDSIMGFVSGIQLSANNMLRVGDWIVMSKYGADGTVIEVTLNTTIPPYALVSDSFQNWRGMQESGGRRVKRSIRIDMNSVKFCTPEMLDKYRKIHLLADYIDETERVISEYNETHHIDNSLLVNGRRQTNLGVFRAYLNNYLKNLDAVNQEMTCMVRQLQPTEQGIPIELYFFSAIKEWVVYESIQADVFDHVLAIIPEFELRVFQNPTGSDFRELRTN